MADVAPTVLFPDRQPDEPEETQTQIVEAGGMDVGEDASDLLCSRCGSVLNAENLSAGRGARHTKAVCKTCVAVWQTLHRNLAGLPEEWQGLSMEEQRAFFKKCSDLKKSGSGPLQYKAVKAVLVESMVESSASSDTIGVGGSYYTLEYYAKLGLDTGKIEQHAPKEQHPFLGDVYMVPIKSVNHEERREKVQKTLLNAERNVKKRKDPEQAIPKAKPKAKAKGQPAPPVELDEKNQQLHLELQDFIDLASDSDDEEFKAVLRV